MAKGDKIKVGRPIKYSFSEKSKLMEELKCYIGVEEYPTMPDFCVRHKVSKRRIYEWARGDNENADTKKKYPLREYFTELIEIMNCKQEQFIEKNVMLGNITPSFAIFKLKQQGIGWSDKADIGITGDMSISIGLPAEFKKHEN
jgi:hypothetical protein